MKNQMKLIKHFKKHSKHEQKFDLKLFLLLILIYINSLKNNQSINQSNSQFHDPSLHLTINVGTYYFINYIWMNSVKCEY